MQANEKSGSFYLQSKVYRCAGAPSACPLTNLWAGRYAQRQAVAQPWPCGSGGCWRLPGKAYVRQRRGTVQLQLPDLFVSSRLAIFSCRAKERLEQEFQDQGIPTDGPEGGQQQQQQSGGQ